MKFILVWIFVLSMGFSTSASPTSIKKPRQSPYTIDSITTVYQSDNLTIRKLSESVYQHITFLNTNSFGRVSCNGMIVINGKEAVVFDTPSGNPDSEELLNYLIHDMKLRVKAVVATHFHADCLGGLDAFHRRGVESYASYKTIELAKSVNAPLPKIGFDDKLRLKFGRTKVYAEFFGEGHTRDNIVGYFPKDKIMFGGCLVKEINAAKGNLADANVNTWSETISKVRQKYPHAKIVIPGHGAVGGLELLDYTYKLFK